MIIRIGVIFSFAIITVCASYFMIMAGDNPAARQESAVPGLLLDIQNVKLNKEFLGKPLYERYCLFCHGVSGNGDGMNAFNLDPRPSNFSDRDSRGAQTKEAIRKIIQKGGNGVGRSKFMPSWEHTLSPTEIQRLVEYILLLRQDGNSTNA